MGTNMTSVLKGHNRTKVTVSAVILFHLLISLPAAVYSEISLSSDEEAQLCMDMKELESHHSVNGYGHITGNARRKNPGEFSGFDYYKGKLNPFLGMHIADSRCSVAIADPPPPHDEYLAYYLCKIHFDRDDEQAIRLFNTLSSLLETCSVSKVAASIVKGKFDETRKEGPYKTRKMRFYNGVFASLDSRCYKRECDVVLYYKHDSVAIKEASLRNNPEEDLENTRREFIAVTRTQVEHLCSNFESLVEKDTLDGFKRLREGEEQTVAAQRNFGKDFKYYDSNLNIMESLDPRSVCQILKEKDEDFYSHQCSIALDYNKRKANDLYTILIYLTTSCTSLEVKDQENTSEILDVDTKSENRWSTLYENGVRFSFSSSCNPLDYASRCKMEVKYVMDLNGLKKVGQ